MKLSLITEGLGRLLAANHYNPATIHFYEVEWRKIGDFLKSEFNDDDFDLEKGMLYLEKQYGFITHHRDGTLSQQRVQLLRVVHMLEDFRLHRVLTRRYHASKNPIELKGEHATVYGQYDKALEAMDLSDSTRHHYQVISKVFLDYLRQLGPVEPAELRLTHCHSCLKTLAGFSFKTVEQNVCGLRHFLRFMNSEGIIAEDLAAKLLMPPVSKTASIPSNWSADDLRKLLKTVDRNSPIGKRDYAMLVLGCVLGIRSVDVKNLRLKDFDRTAKKLRFVQHKTGKPIELPLPEPVGWAVIDYIKNGRPRVHESDCVFIQHMPPFTAFSGGSHLAYIVQKYQMKAHIKRYNKRSGFHSLRHLAASLLLEMETPLPVITEILGHTDPDATAIYLKNDVLKLAECVLEPEDFANEKK